jgi:hypothetical protein
MSRRATPSQAAQNQQIIKNLLKIECNKICADCKRNKRELCPPPNILVLSLPAYIQLPVRAFQTVCLDLFADDLFYQIRDGRHGIWESSYVSVARASIGGWAPISAG